MLVFRSLQKGDFRDINKWCKDHDFPREADLKKHGLSKEYQVLDPITLSDNGYIVEDKIGNKICACWLYLTKNSKIGWFGYPICNKEISYQTRDKALNYMFKALRDEATKLGNPILLTTVEKETLGERLSNLGFLQGDINVTQYWSGFNK